MRRRLNQRHEVIALRDGEAHGGVKQKQSSEESANPDHGAQLA